MRMNDEVEIKHLFLRDGISEDELKIILQQADAETQGEYYGYYSGQIKVKYSKKGKINSILGNPKGALVNSTIRKINEAILENQGSAIGRTIIMASVPIVNWYKYKDVLQILPLPEKPKYGPVGISNDNPGILEFTYNTSQNHILDSDRRNKRKTQLVNFLNLTLNWGLTDANRRTQKYWVNVPLKWRKPTPDEIETGVDTMQPGSFDRNIMYLQTGFGVPQEILNNNNFTELDGDEFKRTPPDQYYHKLGIGIDDRMELPTIFDDLLDKYLGLNDKSRFDRSLHWFSTSNEVWSISQSTSFNCLIQAIEVFCKSEPDFVECGETDCPNRKLNSEKCTKCNDFIKIGGPTSAFRDFVDGYAAGIPDKLKTQLYSLRSDISHGSLVLASDQPSFGSFDRTNHEQRAKYDLTKNIVRTCLINWLNSH